MKNADTYDGINYYDKSLKFLKNSSVNQHGFRPKSLDILSKTVETYIDSQSMHKYIFPKFKQNAKASELTSVIPKWKVYWRNEKPRAIVYPFNKEMHSIACFESLLKIDVVGYYDHRISINNHKKVCNVLEHSSCEKIIKPISELDWTGDFDLVVCGHCDTISSLTQTNDLNSIITNCLKYNKKLYSFDDPSRYASKYSYDDKNCIYYPYIDKSMVIRNRFQKLRKSGKPVLGVYGTSSRQGKHTLQLYLRMGLAKRGYKVGQLGTEPHGYLFGFDFVYPMGYNSSVYVNGYDAINVLNEAMWDIERLDPDIIITGCQSGTVPYNINYLSNISLSSFDFYLGTAPDAVILCVNPFDQKKYIEKSIKFLEGLGNAKVIAIAIFPSVRKSNGFESDINIKIDDEELDIIRMDFEQSFNVATFINQKESVDKMCNEVIKFFRE